ncbi:MAG: acyl-CoA thioesterase [Deltaproteobacteria bacterium]|nr:acyl-CoA thioesterase [Deltaproteobacteria bacterium]
MRFHEQVHAVYFDDLDAFQILHNARYLLMFERTIGSFWHRLGWGGVLDAQRNPDQFHVVRANTIEYLRAFHGTGELRCRVWVEKLGSTSLTFGVNILPMDEDVPHARGTRTIVRVEPLTFRPLPWTASFREQIGPWLRRE